MNTTEDSAAAWDYPRDWPMDALPRAFGEPVAHGTLKATPEDFIVIEQLGFELSGDGEHVFLCIEKTGENTEHVARLLARCAGVAPLAVGYAGLKDRHGRTRQWFSVQLPGKAEPSWQPIESPTLRILETGRHSRKLRRGALESNTFSIRLREVDGDTNLIAERIRRVAREGASNYFGPQRFGRDGGNLGTARDMLLRGLTVRSRHHRGLYLSAARSYLFNRILARRVEQANWNQLVPGDALMFQGSNSLIRPDAIDESCATRVASLDLHPAGTLWGLGEPLIGDRALAEEAAALSACGPLCTALQHAGLERAMRPLRVAVPDLSGRFTETRVLQLEFSLPAGTYATSVLREIVDTAAAGSEALPGEM